MNKKHYLLFLTFFILLLVGCTNNSPSIKANNGVIDVKGYNFSESGLLQLDGEWLFAWDEMLPEGVKDEHSSFIHVPGSWNKVDDFPPKGFATYTLYIENLEIDKEYAIKVPAISSAYNLYINDTLVESVGKPGLTANDTLPAMVTEEVLFTPASNVTKLTLVMANFHHRDGGMWDSLEVGTTEQIITQTKLAISYEMMLLGILLLSGLYHITLFLLRKTELYLLLFGTFCLVIGLRLFVMHERILMEIWPAVPFSIINKLEYLSFYSALPLFIWFLYYLFGKEVSKTICKILTYISIPFSIIVIFTPVSIFTETLYYFQALTLLTIAYVIYTLFLAVKRRREGARLVAIFACFYAYTVVMDIIYVQSSLGSFELSNVGLFVFIFSQVYIIAKRLYKAFDEAEKYSLQLRELNLTLEEKILKRTKSLEQSKKELQSANDTLKKLSYYDQLTKIPNRRYLENVYNDLWHEVQNLEKSISFIYFDIDYFKKYNDTYGHQEGDETLYKVANCINDFITEQGGIAARMGGEEFVAVLSNTSADRLEAFLEECRKCVENLKIPHCESQSSDYVTISIGAAFVYPKFYDITKQKLITIADEALYKAKETGRNRVCINILKQGPNHQ
jgi:diguanylate cyclase (GGDEF)-like protein